MDMLASDAAADIWQKIALQHHYFYRKNKRRLYQDRTPTHGYATSREAAMAAFAKSWRRE
jgi:hypothetical protein